MTPEQRQHLLCERTVQATFHQYALYFLARLDRLHDGTDAEQQVCARTARGVSVTRCLRAPLRFVMPFTFHLPGL